MEWHAEVHRAVRAIHHHTHTQQIRLMLLHDIDRLLHATALGHHVLNHQHLLARRDLEPAPQHQLALFLLHENEPDAQLPRHFLTDHEAAHRRCYNRHRTITAHLIRDGLAELLHDRHILQRLRALEELPTVQPAPQNKMPLQQRARLPEQTQSFFIRHGVDEKQHGV